MDERGVVSKMWDSSILPSWKPASFQEILSLSWNCIHILQWQESYSSFFLSLFIPSLLECSPTWLRFFLLPFWGLLVFFHQPLSSTPALSVNVPQALCSLWINFITPPSSFITFFSHLFSNLPSLFSESQIWISGPDRPNTFPEFTTLKIVVISASQASVSKSQHLTFSQTICSFDFLNLS